MRTLNLGILAHVDAGKTSLTERLLYAAGVIDQIGSVDDGSTQTDSFADRDDAFLAAYVDDETTVSYCQLRGGLAAQTRQALVHPVFFGSAITGAGVDSLTAGIAESLPAAEGDADGPVSGTVSRSNAVRRGRRSRTSVCSREQYEREIGCDSAGPTRGSSPRSDHNPLNRKEYLLHVVRGVAGRWEGV